MPKIIKFVDSHYVWSLIVIVFIALILRVILIDKIPGGLQGDESLIVYNAWSIAQTGADVFNDKLPIQLRGYGWGENSFIVYLIVALIKIFGPFNVTIFRLAVVFFHLVLIVFSFLLARELFDRKVGLLTSLFLAFSPWDLALSRILFNVSILPCFFIAGLYFLIKAIKSKKLYFFLLAGFIFSLTFYIYALSFFWVPLLLIILTISFWPEVKQLKFSQVFIFFGVILVLSLPIILFYLKNQFGLFLNLNKLLVFSLPDLADTRFDTVSIFNEVNKSVLLILIKNYFSHLNPVFLFFNATLPCFVKYFGLIQLYQLPFLVLGLFFMLIHSRKASHRFIILWLLAAPLPVALTIENIPHPLRFIGAMPVFEMITGVGLIYFVDKILAESRKKIFLIVVSIVGVLILCAYIFNFFIVYPRTSFREQQSGSQELSEFIRINYDEYDKIYVINTIKAYMFFHYNYLYYQHIQPRIIQQQNLSQIQLYLIADKVIFTTQIPESTEVKPDEKTLYLLPVCENSDQFIKSKTVIKTFNDLDNIDYFIAVK